MNAMCFARQPKRVRILQAVLCLVLSTFVVSRVVGRAEASDKQITCTSAAGKVTAVADTDGHTTHYDLQGANGAPKGWEPSRLLYTTVNVGEGGCLIAHFSSHRAVGYGFGDTYTIFQVRVDGVPMIGHTTACSDGAVFVNCLLAPQTADISMHSYDLFRPVQAGLHRVEVLYAGCCNGKGAYVGGSVLTLEHS
jgi:hypothetical protein